LCPETRRDTLENKLNVRTEREENMTEEQIAKLHMKLLLNSGITYGTPQSLYSTLLSMAEDKPSCTLSIEDLFSLTKRSPRTIKKYLGSLEDMGLVKSSPKTGGTGPGKTTEYFLPKLKQAVDEFVAKKKS
jgi:hypothetical protein